jgi:hypothetical protein
MQLLGLVVDRDAAHEGASRRTAGPATYVEIRYGRRRRKKELVGKLDNRSMAAKCKPLISRDN